MTGKRRIQTFEQKSRGKNKGFRYFLLILGAAGLVLLSYGAVHWYLAADGREEAGERPEITAGFRDLFEGEKAVEVEEFSAMRLVVPAADIDLEVKGDVDTYDPDLVGNEPWEFSREDYDRWLEGLDPLLDVGPVYYQFSDLPGTKEGNVVIAGHRAGRWNFFRYLDELAEGDQIYLEVAGYRFTYLVEDVYQVDASDWEMMKSTEEPAITLQTCAPLGVPNPPYRLNARGYLEKVEPLDQVDDENGGS